MFNKALLNFVIAGLVLVPLIAGCDKTHQAPGAQKSYFIGDKGVLGDYSMLRKEKSRTGATVFITGKGGKAFFAKYKKVIIDPVTIWQMPDAQRPEGSPLRDIPLEDLQNLAIVFRDAMVKELEQDYEIVQAPGPDVFRLRTAITEASDSPPVLDFISTFEPITRTISGISKLSTGTNIWVGQASVEAKLIDSQTGDLLMAGIDRRSGEKTFKGVTSSWDDVKHSFEYWAKGIRWRLCHESGRSGCMDPTKKS
jgi:hypothetical protein